jgi:hypothetical protein
MPIILKGLSWLVEQLKELVLAVLAGVQDLGEALLGGTLDAIMAIFPTWDPSPIVAGLAQANRILPVSEAAAFLASYASLWVIVMAFRYVRGLIPFLGN